MGQAEQCSCGAAVQASTEWCPRCYRAYSLLAAPAEPGPGRPTSPITPRRPASTLGRWDATAITFALRGRIIATILFTLPMLWFGYFLVPFGFVGIVTYGTVYPRALRHIWIRADRM